MKIAVLVLRARGRGQRVDIVVDRRHRASGSRLAGSVSGNRYHSLSCADAQSCRSRSEQPATAGRRGRRRGGARRRGVAGGAVAGGRGRSAAAAAAAGQHRGHRQDRHRTPYRHRLSPHPIHASLGLRRSAGNRDRSRKRIDLDQCLPTQPRRRPARCTPRRHQHDGERPWACSARTSRRFEDLYRPPAAGHLLRRAADHQGAAQDDREGDRRRNCARASRRICARPRGRSSGWSACSSSRGASPRARPARRSTASSRRPTRSPARSPTRRCSTPR